MSVEVKIVGFDHESDLFEEEWDVPVGAMPQIRKIAHVPDTDPHLLGSYPLDTEQMRMIAEVAHIAVDPARYAYFLEAYRGGC